MQSIPVSSLRRYVLLPVLACLFAGSHAYAQPFDHLKCFKMRDQATFSVASVDLDALAAEYGLESCTVRGRAREVCVPVNKAVTAIEDGSLISVEGEELTLNRLCYKLNCPDDEQPPLVMSDQFGTRTVTGGKAVKLCTPAILGTPTESLDDTFDGSSLDPDWSVLNPSLATISVSGGALHLTPTAAGGTNVWYQNGEGPLVYKDVTGDFDVRTVITVRDPAIPANPPPPQYRLAGILARDPAGGSVNTVHVALGSGSNLDGTCYEYKSTDDSVSTWFCTPTPSASAELRLRRAGTTVEMYWRALSSDPWTQIYTVMRPDLPATLQVGPMVYSVDAPPSIEALFDEIVFQ